jgi:hypothetical protein
MLPVIVKPFSTHEQQGAEIRPRDQPRDDLIAITNILPKTNRTGVDVTITIFCDFCRFSAKKLAIFGEKNWRFSQKPTL